MRDWFHRAKRAAAGASTALGIKSRAGVFDPHWRRFAFETLEPRQMLAAAGLITTPQTYSGQLTGKYVFTSGGHGWSWNGSSYVTDRPDYWQASGDTSDGDIVEDFENQDQMSLYADYALRAGATVIPMRPVGHQLNEVVVDNDSPSVTYSGTWSDSTVTRFYDEDYGLTADTVSYRFASTVTGAETAVATYTPNIPAAGFYPVYTWVHYGTDRTAQTYRINHTDGTTQVTVDHSKVGDGWVYLGTYHFNAGQSITEGSVQISNKAPVAGKVVIADAIRFGNGMGDYIETGAPGVSGKPREDENSYHWIARSIGQGATITGILGSDTNVSAPSDFAEYMFHGTFGEAVYISFHSNGGSGLPTSGGRGSRGLYCLDPAQQTPNQTDLALLLADQIRTDMVSLNGTFETNWTTDTTNFDNHINFGEINLGGSAEMDATIIEVAFHDNQFDNMLLRDPKVRDQIARSVYQGTVQYFSTFGTPGTANVSLPTAPTNMRVVSNASGQVTVSWSPGPTTPDGTYNDAATGYRVYASVDGYGFDGGRTVAGVGTTSLTISGLDPNTPYYFKVTSTNSGGESLPSEVVTALPSGGAKQVLIVNGFDRYDRFQDIRYPYTQQGYGTPDPDGITNRVWPRFNNSRDYVVQVATAIQTSKPGVHFESTSNEVVISGAVNLNNYDSVIWILGNESTKNSTFDSTEQTKVTNFINAGGNLFVSGSEIAYDLDNQNHGRSFFQNTLGASYAADDANIYRAVPTATGIFASMNSFVFSDGSGYSSLDSQVYDVAYPDVINPTSGSIAALSYSGGTGGTAAIQRQGTGGKGSVVMFGFPFEALTNASIRTMAMGKILDFFNVVTFPNADFNGNGTVDAADFVLWRKNNGLAIGAAQTQGDANGDGAVNGADYDVVRAQFGSSPGAGSGVQMVAEAAEAALLASESPSLAMPVSTEAAASELAPSNSAEREMAFSALSIEGDFGIATRIPAKHLVNTIASSNVATESQTLLASVTGRNRKDSSRRDERIQHHRPEFEELGNEAAELNIAADWPGLIHVLQSWRGLKN